MNSQPPPALASATSPPLDQALSHLARILIRRELDADVPWLAVENAERHLAGVIATASLAANLAGRETTFRTAERARSQGMQRRISKFAAVGTGAGAYGDPLAPLENNGGPNDGDNDGAYDVPPLPTYQQAVDAILRRTPAVARTWQDVAAVMARNGIAFARAATQKIADRIRESLAGTIAVGQGREYAVSLMQLIAPWTRAYSEMVYRTNTAQAYTDGLVEFASDPSVSDAVAGFRFSATGDANTRPNHQAADGLTARADDMVWQQLRPPLGYACFPAGVNVSGAFTGASRIWYDGPIVIIQSRNGRRLPVTVNHPILTRRGWIRAEEVRNGDDCVCYGNEVESFAHRAGNWPLPDVSVCGRAINDQDVPARIEDVFDAFGTNRTGSGRFFGRMRTLPLDFNGDGRFANGDIDIYSIDGVFERATNATQFKGIENRICEFVANATMFACHRLSAVATLGGSDDASDVGGMSGGNLPFYGIRASGPDFDPLQPLLFGRAALLNARIGETQIDRNAGYAEFLSQLVDAGTGEIFFDKVINVERNSHHGYVYDLESASSRETGNGWMVTNGIVTSNCRCRLIVLTTAEAKRRRMLTSRGVLPDAVWPQGAYPDPGFRR